MKRIEKMMSEISFWSYFCNEKCLRNAFVSLCSVLLVEGEPAALLPSLKTEDAAQKYGPVKVQEGLAKEYLRFVSGYQKS